MAPGPPPVATTRPLRARSRPSSAASAKTGGAAVRGVPAHDAHHGAAGAELRAGQFIEGIADRVVMQGRGQGGVQPVALARAGCSTGTPGRPACPRSVSPAMPGVELLRGVQLPAVGVERHAPQAWGRSGHRGCAATSSTPSSNVQPRKIAPCASRAVERRRPAAQVQRLGMPAVHGLGARRATSRSKLSRLSTSRVRGLGCRLPGGVHGASLDACRQARARRCAVTLAGHAGTEVPRSDSAAGHFVAAGSGQETWRPPLMS